MDQKKPRMERSGVTRRGFLKTAGAAGAVGAITLAHGPFVHAQKKVTLRVINQEPDPGTVKFFETAFAEWENKTGVKVMLDTVPGGEMFPKMSAAIKAGNPYHIGNELFIGNINIMASEGWIVPMTPLIKKIGMDDFGPNILFPLKGEVWWYPYDYNFAHWFYRKDIFQAKGLKEPKTWAEFAACAKACMDDKKNMYGLCLGIGNGQWVDWLDTAFMWAEGVKFFDDKWNVILDSPQMKPKMIGYLQFFKEIYQYMPPGMTQISWGDHTKLFTTESVAMSPYSGRMIEHVDQLSPHLADKVGLFPYPSRDGSRFAINHGYDGWVVGKTDQVEESMKLMEWLVTEKLIDFYSVLPIHYQPTRLSIYENPKWKSLPKVQKYGPIVEIMKGFLTRKDIIIDAVDIQGPEVDPRPGIITRKFVMPTMLQNLVLKNMPPEECLQIAVNSIKEIMKGS
jgi:multiple sugar transport system substrate-binding protein